MSAISSRIARHALPLSAGIMAVVEGTNHFFDNDSHLNKAAPTNANTSDGWQHNLSTLRSSVQWIGRSTTTTITQMESSSKKAYHHDPKDFDYYVQHPTVDDLPILLQKFDQDGLEVWPWIWTHPNENGPHYVFLLQCGKTATIPISVVHRVQELRKESPRNNILIILSDDDESALHRAAKEAGVDANVFDQCHCGIVTGVNLELLNVRHKILMLDDERVIAFDYLTIC